MSLTLRYEPRAKRADMNTTDNITLLRSDCKSKMTVAELKEALTAYPDDMEVEICEGKVKMTDDDEVILDPYWDFNTLVLTYQSME